MKSLEEFVEGLPTEKQFIHAYKLLKKGIIMWNEFVTEKNLSYSDSIVGLKHNVSGDLVLKT
jgi:hypothetical protein